MSTSTGVPTASPQPLNHSMASAARRVGSTTVSFCRAASDQSRKGGTATASDSVSPVPIMSSVITAMRPSTPAHYVIEPALAHGGHRYFALLAW